MYCFLSHLLVVFFFFFLFFFFSEAKEPTAFIYFIYLFFYFFLPFQEKIISQTLHGINIVGDSFDVQYIFALGLSYFNKQTQQDWTHILAIQ